MRKHLLSRLALCILCPIVITACGDDDNTGEMYTPDELLIDGPSEVAPNETATYFANIFSTPESYSWTVPSGATIIEGDGTSSISVTFPVGSGGDISVSARGVSGTKSVAVTSPVPMASVSLDSGTILSERQTANVIVNFDRDIATAPDIVLVPAEGSGSGVTSVERVDENTFQLSYSAGAGDGTEQITISNAVATAAAGGAAMDTIIAFNVYERDNTPATGDLFASQTPVSDDMMVTISAVFSEPLRTADSVRVSIASSGILTDTTYVDAAAMTTEDGMTWTYEFQPSGGRNEVATVSVSNLPTDRAGNTTEDVEDILIQIRNEE